MLWCWRFLNGLPNWLRKLWAVLVVLFWCYVCFAPTDPDAPPIINDKLAHFIGNFGVTGSLFIAGFMQSYWPLAGLVMAYSFAIECVQYLLPGRYFSGLDMAANTAGIIVAVLLIKWLQAHRDRV